MAAVNQDQLVGSLIPDVYIKTITLETSGRLSEKQTLILSMPESQSKLKNLQQIIFL